MTTCLEISVTADGTIITPFSPLVQEHFKFSCTTMNWNYVMQLDLDARSTRLVSIVQHATPPISCYYLGALATGRVTLPTSCKNFRLEFIRPVHVSNTHISGCVCSAAWRQAIGDGPNYMYVITVRVFTTQGRPQMQMRFPMYMYTTQN